MPKKPDNQMGFSFDEETNDTEVVSTGIDVELQRHNQPVGMDPATAKRRAEHIYQIVRDQKVLNGPAHHYEIPGREFYVERIAMHRATVEKIDREAQNVCV